MRLQIPNAALPLAVALIGQLASTASMVAKPATPPAHRSPSSRWSEAALRELRREPLTNPRNSRVIAATHVAIREAVVMAARSEATRDVRSGAACGAAAAVLNELVPRASEHWRRECAAQRERARDRREFDRGRVLGEQVGARVLERVARDGATAADPVDVPVRLGHWTGRDPIEPHAGTWQPWVLESPSQFRPAPPSAHDSRARHDELLEIRAVQRTPERVRAAHYWQTFDGIFTEWYAALDRALVTAGLENDDVVAATAFAAAAVAHHDAMLAAWDAKYCYWTIRPGQLDPEIETLFPTPNHPSYPAAHAVVSTAIAEVIAGFCPEMGRELRARAIEASESRLWAGVHYRSDLTAGAELGRRVAVAVLASVPRRFIERQTTPQRVRHVREVQR
jgi:membrane-associated phospholipid phosphatase